MSLTWHEREKAEMDRFWAEYRSKNGAVAETGGHVLVSDLAAREISAKPPCPPDTRPWKLKAFIVLGLMVYFWWQVAKWL